MAIAKLFQWNALVLISFFIIACSDSGGGSGSPRGLETPIGHSIVEGNEGTSVLTLYFISPVDGPLSYSTFNITAAEKSDYELLADTFQAEKDKEYAFDVVIYGDTQIEGDESLGINFKNAQGESVGTIIGSISNDDYPTVSATSPQVIEGDTGTSKLVFTFTLSAAVVDDYSITVSSTGESASLQSVFANLATPEIDFLPVNQELVFTNGELEKQLEVTVYADNIIENDETVLLNVLREDQPILAEVYANGTIRTDETPDINGFQLSVDVGTQQTEITEGSSINPFELTWKKVDYEITVSKPQNILQEQNLVFTLLPIAQAKAQYGVTYLQEGYVNLTDNHDLCFNDLSLDNALECQTSLDYILKQDEASFVISIYVKEDITRELNEIFIMNMGNDQNVLFSNFQAKIINDDSENLQIKIGDEFVDLKTFTNNQSVYELTEPRAATQGTAKVIEENTLTFRLNSPLDVEYSPEYELNKYFKERPADNGEYGYADDNKTLIFSKDSEAPQDVTLGINLESDGTYDGDKYITLTFKETDISPLIIKIIDSDYPKLEAATKQAGVKQDSIVDNGFNYIELLEQPNAESKANEDGFMEYQYTLSQGLAAEPLLSDIKYKVTLQNVGIGKGELLTELTCLSAGHTEEYNLATLTGDDSDVSIFDKKGVQIPSGGEILLEEGATSYDLTIRVKNDAAIECQEVFQLTVVPALAPEDIQAQVALRQNFIIKDSDKALVTVQSWQTAETDSATKTQNFQFNANKKVNAVLTPILTGQGLNCNADDLNPPVDVATTVSFTPDSLEPTFPIYIKGDITVEPNEACELKIGTLSADLETLIEVQYLDSTGVVIENGEYATGVIVNDDKLNIGIGTTDVTEPAKDAPNVSVGTYSWDKKIAPNVGKIAIIATPTACTGSQNCVEDSDTTLGLHNATPVVPQEIVIHQGDETAILLPSPSTDLPISIIGDDIVEEIETLNFSVARSAGTEYIEGISDTDVSITITSEDRLELQLTGNKVLDEPSSDSTPYSLSWNKQLELPANSLPEIRISLSDTETCDGDETQECMSENLDYNLDSAPLSLNNGSTTNLALTNFTLKPDILVELPEALNLTLFSSSPYIESITHITSATGFVTNTSELHSVVTHALDWELQVISDDKITITRPTESAEIAESCTAEDSCATVARLAFSGLIPQNGPTITLSVDNNCVMPNPVDGTNPNQCASEVLPSTDLTSVIDSSESDFKFNENYQSINIHTYDEDTSLTSKDIKLTVNNDSWVEVLENINLVYTAEQGRDYIGGLDEVDGEGNPVLSGLEILEPQPISLTSEDVATVSATRVTGTGTTLDSTCNFTAGTQFSEGGTDGTDVNGCTSHYQLVIDAPIAKEVGTISAAFKLYDAAALANKTPVSFTDDIAATISSTDFTGSTIVSPSSVPSEPGSQQLLIPVHTQETATTISAFANRTLFVFNHKEDVIADGTKLLGFNLVEATSATTDYFNVSGSAVTEEVIDDDSLTFTLTAPTVIDQDTSTPNILDITEGVSGQSDLTYTLSWSGVTNITLTELILDFVIAGSATQGPSDDYTISLGQGEDSPIKIENGKIIFTTSDDNSSGSETITFHINGDETVELPETITASLVINDVATSQVAEVDTGSSDNVAINIPNDDFVTVTLYSNGIANEGSDSPASTYQPFSYSIDKNIAKNVPTIQLYMEQVACPTIASYNCAEAIVSTSDTSDLGDFYIDGMNILKIHEYNLAAATDTLKNETVNGDGTGAIIPTPISEIYVRGDSRIEDDETIAIKFDKQPASVTLTGTSYIADIVQSGAAPAPVATSLTLESIINNDDKISLEIARGSDFCNTSFSAEGHSCVNKIKVSSGNVDSDVGEISLPIYHFGDARNQKIEIDDGVNIIETDPQDYKLELKIETDSVYQEQTTQLIIKESSVAFSSTERRLKISIIDDEFVENSETIQFDLIPTAHTHTNNEIHQLENEHISSIKYVNQSKTRFGDAISITSSDSLAVDIAATSYSEVSLDQNGDEVLTTTDGQLTEGAENTYKYINYTATLSNPIAPDYGTVTFNLEDDTDGTDGSPLQTASATDFKVQVKGTDNTYTESQSIIIHDTGTSTPDNALIRDFRFEINPDTTLELDDVISQNPSLTGATATLAGLANIFYTIQNDDFLTMRLAGTAQGGVLSKDAINEGTSGTDTSVSFVYNTDVEIPADYPDLNITLTNNADTSTAEMNHGTQNDDAVLQETSLHSDANGTPTGPISNGLLTLAIKADGIVEPTEELVLDLGSNTGGVVFKDENGDTITQLKQPITNDDFIQLELVPTSTGDLNEGDEGDEGDTVAVNITTDYESEELTELERQISFELVSSGTTASATDYTIESAITLPVDGNTTDTDQLLLTIEPDYIIEIKETLNLTLNHSQYMQQSGGALTTSYSYDIANDDYLTVTRTQALIESSDDVINHFDIEICVPSGYTIQSGTGDLTFTATAEKITKDPSSDFKAATCDDFTLSDSSNSCDLENGFTSNNHTLDVDGLSSEGCRTAELLSATANNDVNQNVAFQLILDGLSDDRIDTSFNATQEIVIINDDFINMLDTGLTHCVDNGVTGKNIAACDGGDIETGYDLQDAVVTSNDNQYPDLAYTYINEKGEPVVTKPTEGQVCIQDNNTGYIWTQTIVNPNGRNGFSWDDPEFPSSAIGYNCGFVSDVGSKSWKYPSVQDLLSFWNAKKLKTAREFGLLVSNETGEVINDVDTGEPLVTPNSITGDQYMRYWTDQSCGANHFFAVDFLSGEVHCQVNTTINSVIGVYK